MAKLSAQAKSKMMAKLPTLGDVVKPPAKAKGGAIRGPARDRIKALGRK